MATNLLVKIMDVLIILSLMRKKVPITMTIAAASLMTRRAGAAEVAIWPGPVSRDFCLAPAPATGFLTPASTGGIILGLVLGISLVLNLMLLCCYCRCGLRPPLQLEGHQAPVAVAVAVPATVRPRQRDAATQSQCIYRRGPNPRFVAAFNFEGYIETHLH